MSSWQRASWRSEGELIASVGLALIAACAMNSQKSDPPSALNYGAYETNGKRAVLLSHTIDGERRRPGVAVKPGHHRLTIKVRWSNDWIDETVLDVDFAPGHVYELMRYELAPGQDPAAADFKPARRPTLAQSAAAGAVAGMLFWTWPILIPYVVITHRNDVEPKARPFTDCCFVWVQDKAGGAVVAGLHPPSVKPHGDSAAQPADGEPPATGH